MRKLRTLDNTKPTEQRAFKKSLKHVDKCTKEDVITAVNAIQRIVTDALENAFECSIELQEDIQKRCAVLSISSSNEGVLTEADINKLLMPLALKLQNLHTDYLFDEIEHYSPIRAFNGHGVFNPTLDNQILRNWLETFNGLLERCKYEIEHF